MSRSRLYSTDPFFGLFDHPYHGSHPSRQRTQGHEQPFDNFYGSTFVRSPVVELVEEGKEYIVEAELPGVRKEDLDVRVGEGGKTLTIEGKVLRRGAQATDAQEPAITQNGKGKESDAVSRPNINTLAGEPESPYSAIFSRTFQLPRPVDGNRVSAKLEHGVLLLRIPQMEERGSVRVNIE